MSHREPGREPGWWYDEKGAHSLAARLLAPAAAVVTSLAARRIATARPFRASIPVICVGNFTVGGTGKTPMTRLLLDLLTARGERPVVLSRGYGGKLRGPVEVNIKQHTARDVGDEPLMLARDARVVVARGRAEGARFIVALDPAPSVIVMDDGLQNPGLAKDLTLALVDAKRGLGNGCVLPAGPLRAGLDLQLGLADAVVITGAPNEAQESRLRTRLATHFGGTILRARPEPVGDQAWIKGAPVVAFAAIAAPARFFELVEAQGGHLVAAEAFPDHRPFSEACCKALLARGKSAGALLVTTEKDLARLSGLSGAAQELAAHARALPIRLALDDTSAAALASLVSAALARARAEPQTPVAGF